MTRIMFSAVVGAAALAITGTASVGTASASDAIKLSDAQMDEVTAGLTRAAAVLRLSEASARGRGSDSAANTSTTETGGTTFNNDFSLDENGNLEDNIEFTSNANTSTTAAAQGGRSARARSGSLNLFLFADTDAI